MDLYMYYTTIALGMSSPSLRAAAISVLVLLVPQDPVHGKYNILLVFIFIFVVLMIAYFLTKILMFFFFVIFLLFSCVFIIGAELLKGIRHLASGDTWWEVRVQGKSILTGANIVVILIRVFLINLFLFYCLS